MSTPINTTVKVSDPGEVLAAVPHLLGFTPAESLVVIVIRNASTVPRVGVTLRMDLPARTHYYAAAEYLINGPLRTQQVEAVMLAVVGRAGAEELRPPPESTVAESRLPYWQLVEVLREVLSAAGVWVMHTTWSAGIEAGATWCCYHEVDCAGTIADPRSSPLAAAMTAAGAVTFESREELQRLVAPEDEKFLARRSAKLDALTEERESERGMVLLAKRDVDLVFDAIRRVDEGDALTEEDYVFVLLALSDHRVRDIALSSALDRRARAAEQLWLTLVRKAPPPEVAEVAALLAFSAYLRGEGALAGVALERIEKVRPDHRLGGLLRQALDFGIPPDELEVIAKDAVEDARILLEEGEDA